MTLKPPKTRDFAIVLVLIIGMLTVLQVASILSQFHIPGDPLEPLRWIVDFDRENNLPTWYSSILLFVAAILLALIAAGKPRHDYKRHWVFLSGTFVFLSLDETASFHEVAMGFFLPLMAIMAVAYVRFVFALPLKTRLLIILAGVLYITGALVIEIVNILVAQRIGLVTFEYGMMVTLEECLEMVGVSIFGVALLDYLEKNFQPRLMLSAPE